MIKKESKQLINYSYPFRWNVLRKVMFSCNVIRLRWNAKCPDNGFPKGLFSENDILVLMDDMVSNDPTMKDLQVKIYGDICLKSFTVTPFTGFALLYALLLKCIHNRA